MEEHIGCWREAQRADRVAVSLERLRSALDLKLYDQVTALLKEVESASRLLRDIYDIIPFYRSRLHIISVNLNVLLPSMALQMKDILAYLDSPNTQPETRWTLMHQRLGEKREVTPTASFVMFTEFIIQTIYLLSKSPLYSPTSSELLRMKILRLRALQSIPNNPVFVNQAYPVTIEATNNPSWAAWAMEIFDRPPKSRTEFRHIRMSKCYGPPMIDSMLGITTRSNILFKLPFDKNRLSVSLYQQSDDPAMVRLICRWMDRYYNPLYSSYGAHELCVVRKGSALQFRRWSHNGMHSTLWLAVFFKTWEKMVLFHCSFGALKSRSALTINVTSDDVILAGEKKLFQAKIIDDGFEHILSVRQDTKCGGLRLHAAVRTGELRGCPVWTAFVTHQSASSAWIDRRSKHRIWLKDIYLNVFCHNYNKLHQIKKDGDFELYFANESAADAFQDTFEEGSTSDSLVKESNHPSKIEESDVGEQVKPKSQLNTTKNTQLDEYSTEQSDIETSDEESDRTQGSEADIRAQLESLNWADTWENAASQEDLLAVLFQHCNTIFPQMSDKIRRNTDLVENSICDHFREEFRKFYIWNDLFQTHLGKLGTILSNSRNLKEAVFGLMAQWAQALCKIPRALPNCDWTSLTPRIAELEAVCSKIDQVAVALSRDNPALSRQNLELTLDLNFDDESDSSSIESVGLFEDIIEEMKVCTECLVDMIPSLDMPAQDLEVVEQTRSPQIVPEESQPWWNFFLRTQDKFPGAERQLVIRLGQVVWRRWEEIRLNHAARIIRVDALGSQPAIPKPEHELEIGSHYSDSVGSFDPSTKFTKSTYSGSSVFDDEPKRAIKVDEGPTKKPKLEEEPESQDDINIGVRIKRQDSFSSVRSSIETDSSKAGQRRVPPLPIESRNGAEFECFVCMGRIKDIYSRESWKKHIFGDLEPYVCTLEDCPDSLKTFKLRHEWSKHESEAHGSQFQKRLEAKRCPLCLAEVGSTKHLSRHIGRHLRELSLASLPPLRSAAKDDVFDESESAESSESEAEATGVPLSVRDS